MRELMKKGMTRQAARQGEKTTETETGENEGGRGRERRREGIKRRGYFSFERTDYFTDIRCTCTRYAEMKGTRREGPTNDRRGCAENRRED